MLHLTVDRERFNDPQQAFQHLLDNRCISLLMQDIRRVWRRRDPDVRLYSPRYIFAIEFQSGGWPHVHIMLDAAWVAQDRLEALWSKRGLKELPTESRPGFGFVWVTRDDCPTALDAAETASGYLTKQPEGGHPEWVRELGGEGKRVRLWGNSAGLFSRIRPKKDVNAPKKPRKPMRPARSHAERMAVCSKKANLICWEDELDPATGKLEHRGYWLAEVGPADPAAGPIAWPKSIPLQPGPIASILDQARRVVKRDIKVLRSRKFLEKGAELLRDRDAIRRDRLADEFDEFVAWFERMVHETGWQHGSCRGSMTLPQCVAAAAGPAAASGGGLPETPRYAAFFITSFIGDSVIARRFLDMLSMDRTA